MPNRCVSELISTDEPRSIKTARLNILLEHDQFDKIPSQPPRWCFHLIVVRGFEYARDPESYTSGSVATDRASLAGQVKG
jgi:hypothetical protein